MFEAETRAVILERLKEYYAEFKQTDVSMVEGTFSFDTLAANAKEFEKAYAEMDLIVDAAFPRTSWGKYLDYLAEELAGLERRDATAAIVVLTISGTAGATVPKGSLFATENGVNFATDDDAVLQDSGMAEVNATAQAAGAGGNVAAGAINTIPVSIYGVSGVTNAAAAHDGYEEETDDSLLDRLLANKDTPSEELLQEVRDVIDANAPIGATVTVVAPTLKTIDIAMKVTKGVGNEEAIKSVLTSYFKSNVFGTDYTNAETLNQSVTISYAQIGRIILDNSATTGVEDYAGMTINGGTENIVVQYDYMPVVGTVTLT